MLQINKKLRVAAFFVLLLISGLGFFNLVPRVQSAATNITVSADTHVDSWAPNTNFGSYNFFSVLTSGSLIAYGYVKFSLSSLPAGIYISNAKMWLYTTPSVGGSSTNDAKFVSDDSWTEGGITWNNKPSLGSILATTVVEQPTTWYSWDVTTQTRTEYNGDKTLSMGLSNYQGNWEAPFRSKEYNGQDPYLEVSYTQQQLEASGLTVNDYRVNPSQTLTFSGYWYYEGTTTPPPDGDYQVKVKLAGVQKGSTDTTLVNGYFSINDVTAESVVGSYTYTVEANGMYSPGTFSAVIVDKIQVTITANSTDPINGHTVQFTVAGQYKYNGATISSLSFQITRNGSNFATTTPFTDSGTNVRYIYTTSSASETTYGLNTLETNIVNVVWGPEVIIEINQWSGDTEINAGATAFIYFHARFSNNQSSVTSGTVTIKVDTTPLTVSFNSSGWAVRNDTNFLILTSTFNTTAVNVGGITKFTQLFSAVQVRWCAVYSPDITNEQRVNKGETAKVWIHLYYALGAGGSQVPLTDGTVLINGTSATYNSTLVRWEINYVYTGIGRKIFRVSIVSGNTYGITFLVNQGATAEIWDGLNLTSYSIDFANNKLKLRLAYAYDNSSISNGNVSFNGVIARTDAAGWATFNLDSFIDFNWGLTAYGVQDLFYGLSYKNQNQTVPLQKISGIFIQTEDGLTLSSVNSQGGQLSMILSGSGTKFVRVKAPKPYYVKIGSLFCIEGVNWTYNSTGGYTEITASYSTQTILASWIPLTTDTGLSGLTTRSKTVPEQLVEAVSTAVFAISSNYVGAIVSVLALVALLLSIYFGEKTLAVILAFVTVYLVLDMVSVFILKPQLLFPSGLSFLEPLLWVPPQVALEMFGGLAVQQFVQMMMMVSLIALLVGTVYGVSQRRS